MELLLQIKMDRLNMQVMKFLCQIKYKAYDLNFKNSYSKPTNYCWLESGRRTRNMYTKYIPLNRSTSTNSVSLKKLQA